MRTTSNVIPKTYEIEQVLGGNCDVVFATNVTSAEIEVEGSDEKELQYTYDMYRLRIPYSDTLSDRIGENYSSWLELAIEKENTALIETKIKEVNTACQNIIYNGIDLVTEYGKEHFSLSTHDQQNLSAIKMMLASGVSQYPYHADGKSCVLYKAEDLTKLTDSAMAHITYHTTYCNMLKMWIGRETDSEILRNIIYGCELPEDLKVYMEELLANQ